LIKVTAALIIDSGKVLIAKRKPTARLGGMWEFPGGKIENGESPKSCLARELREEFEIDVVVGEHVGTSVWEYDFGTIELMAFKARIVAGDMKLNDHAEVEWVDAEDLDGYDFAPADVPFVEMLKSKSILM